MSKRKSVDLSIRFRRIACYFLALVMAASVVLTVAIGVSSGLLRTEGFVQKRFEKYNSMLLDEVNMAISSVAETTGLPVRAYTNAIQSGHVQTALHQVSNNVVKGFKTDYTESNYLYGYYRTGILNYCKENGIPITEEELVKDACFAVDTFNDVVGDESSNSIIIFALTYTRKPITIIIACVLIFIASVIALDFIGFGRHKKYDYIGIALILAGEVQIILPMFAILMKYTSTLRFMDVDVYNMAIASVLDDIMKIIMIIGAVVLVVGIIITILNFRYYAHKTKTLKTEHDIRVKLMKEQREMHKARFVEEEAAALKHQMEMNDKEIKEE